MLAVALAIAILQTPAGSGGIGFVNRDAVQEALRRGQVAVDSIGYCMTRRSAGADVESLYDSSLSILRDTSRAAEALYPDMDPVSEVISLAAGQRAPRCNRQSLRAYDEDARRASGDAQRLVEADSRLRERGLWLANLKLCGARVVAVEAASPGAATGLPGITLRFSESFGAQVRALTSRSVGRPLSIALDGVVIMSPRVMEPVGEALSITAPDGVPVDRIRAAVAAPC